MGKKAKADAFVVTTEDWSYDIVEAISFKRSIVYMLIMCRSVKKVMAFGLEVLQKTGE